MNQDYPYPEGGQVRGIFLEWSEGACVCVYMCTYFTAQGTDPFALRDGPQTRVLAVGVALVITLITKQHLERERERERDDSINPNKEPHLPTYVSLFLYIPVHNQHLYGIWGSRPHLGLVVKPPLLAVGSSFSFSFPHRYYFSPLTAAVCTYVYKTLLDIHFT